MEEKKRRDSNIELFRILTMMLIVAHHYVVNSQLLNYIDADLNSSRSLFYLLLGAWEKTGINCFVLITGFFMCTSKITLRKFLKLLLEVVFYNLVIYVIFLSFGRAAFSFGRVIEAILPIRSLTDDFISCFLAFYLLIPFLNIGIHAMNRKQHLYLALLLVLFYTMIPTLPGMKVAFNYVTWFSVLFFIGSYLRLYPVKWMERYAAFGFVVSFILAIGSIIILAHFGGQSGGWYMTYYFVSDSNKPLALLVSVFAFLLFKNCRIHYHKWINTVAASTFGVLCIHANCYEMREWLWSGMLRNQEMYYSKLAIPHAIGSVLAVFTVCILIDMLRIHLFENPFFHYYDRNEQKMLRMLKMAKKY